MNDIIRVEEAKGTLVQVWKESNLIEALCFPPSLVFLVNNEPPDPEDIHLGWVGLLEPPQVE